MKTQRAEVRKMVLSALRAFGNVVRAGADLETDPEHFADAVMDLLINWQPISEAPPLARIIAAGPQRHWPGRWWVHEDKTDDDGVPVEHPAATHFIPLSALGHPK